MSNNSIYMEKQMFDFFNTLTFEGKAKAVVNMPNGSAVTLIADRSNFDYLCEDLNIKDKELLNKYYVPKCEHFINLRNDKTGMAEVIDDLLLEISPYLFNELHIGKFALSDEAFIDMNKYLNLCDDDKVRSGETLLYIFNLVMFSNRECWGIQKAYVIIDKIDDDEFNIKVTGTNAEVFQRRFYTFEDEDCYEDDIETIFKDLLQDAVKSIAENIVYGDLYV